MFWIDVETFDFINIQVEHIQMASPSDSYITDAKRFMSKCKISLNVSLKLIFKFKMELFFNKLPGDQFWPGLHIFILTTAEFWYCDVISCITLSILVLLEGNSRLSPTIYCMQAHVLRKMAFNVSQNDNESDKGKSAVWYFTTQKSSGYVRKKLQPGQRTRSPKHGRSWTNQNEWIS